MDSIRRAMAAPLLAAFAAAAGCVAADAADAPPPIIAVGDLHGDYDAYAAILEMAGLIDGRGRWVGDAAVLVQTGDIPDRGPDSRRIIQHLMKLEKQAARKGGRVVTLVGNHEAMNVTGDLRYVDPGEYEAFVTRNSRRLRDSYFKSNKDTLTEFYRQKNPEISDEGVRDAFEADVPLGYLEHRLAWSPKGELGEWAAGNDAIAIIGDTLFVHGGVSAGYAARPVDEINAAVRAAIKGEGDAAILTDELGPLWYRGNAEEFEGGLAEVEAAFAAYGVERLVVGHTPSLAGVATAYEGKVIIIDTGAADYYGGTRSFLRIEAGCIAAVDNGVRRTIEGECAQ